MRFSSTSSICQIDCGWFADARTFALSLYMAMYMGMLNPGMLDNRQSKWFSYPARSPSKMRPYLAFSSSVEPNSTRTIACVRELLALLTVAHVSLNAGSVTLTSRNFSSNEIWSCSSTLPASLYVCLSPVGTFMVLFTSCFFTAFPLSSSAVALWLNTSSLIAWCTSSVNCDTPSFSEMNFRMYENTPVESTPSRLPPVMATKNDVFPAPLAPYPRMTTSFPAAMLSNMPWLFVQSRPVTSRGTSLWMTELNGPKMYGFGCATCFICNIEDLLLTQSDRMSWNSEGTISDASKRPPRALSNSM